MKHFRYFIISLLALLMGTGSVHAQGLGFYLGGKKVELHEGDSVKFNDNAQGEVEVTVTQDGNVTVYVGKEMTFYGDLEHYFQDMIGAMHYFDTGWNDHTVFGYGSVMHIRDRMTADMLRQHSGYDWFAQWASNNASIGPKYLKNQLVFTFFEQSIKATNQLLGAIDAQKASDVQKQYLGVAHAFRAMIYLDMARMYEYLPTDATQPYSNTGKDVTNLTVPIITEETQANELPRLPRATREEMQKFIQTDLDKATEYLATYNRPSKTMPNLACVFGLQARLDMWVEDYAKAALSARKAIVQSQATPLSKAEIQDVENGFNSLAPSAWMWGAQPGPNSNVVQSGIINWTSWMSNETTFGYASYATPVSITPSTYNLISAGNPMRSLFKNTAEGDQPHLDSDIWDNLPDYASLKFRPYQGNVMDYRVGAQSAYPLMRVEEMYFIEAEAKAHLSPDEGVAKLSDFMRKYRDPNFNASTTGWNVESATNAIIAQKRIELWGEGQSFFDIKRLNLSVDRTSALDIDYMPENQRFHTTGRPAWMNLALPTRSYIYKWSPIGEENPNPANCYALGGGTLGTGRSTYDVQFADGIVRDLFHLTTPSQYTSIKACPMENGSGIELQEPFAQLADSTMLYYGSPLCIALNGDEATISQQPLGFLLNGHDVMVESTAKGTFQDGVITFPRNSIVVSYGPSDSLMVVNSDILTSIRMPGSPTPLFGINSGMYDFNTYKSEVHLSDSASYFRVHIGTFEGYDEVRLVCTSSTDDPTWDLVNLPSYGVTVTDTGWVNIPIVSMDESICVHMAGMIGGSVYDTKKYSTTKYPDYYIDFHSSRVGTDKAGNPVVATMYYFGLQVEKGFLALVDKYATTEDIEAQYKAGTLPSVVEVPLSKGGYYQSGYVPFPDRYAQYRLMGIAVADGNVVNVQNCHEYQYEEYFENPVRDLSATIRDVTLDSTNAMFVDVAYDISDFESAYIAILPDTLLTGNVWKVLENYPNKIKVTHQDADNTAIVPMGRPSSTLGWTLAIAGCDAAGRIVKDVLYPQEKLPSFWTKIYYTLDEWTHAGFAADQWPLSRTDSLTTCTYTYKKYFAGTDSCLLIGYCTSLPETLNRFVIPTWGFGTTLSINYDPYTYQCSVPIQYVGTHEQYGDIYISDLHYYVDASYDDFPCTYDPQTGHFTLNVIYFVGEGYFGYGEEEIQINGMGNLARNANPTPLKAKVLPEDIKLLSLDGKFQHLDVELRPEDIKFLPERAKAFSQAQAAKASQQCSDKLGSIN